MRDELCSARWRLAALVLGAGWVVALAVACGGGDDELVSAGRGTLVHGAGAHPGAAFSAHAGADTAGAQFQANGTATPAMAMAVPQPCADPPPQAAHRAAASAHRPAPLMQAHELSDEALRLMPAHPGAHAGTVPLLADPVPAAAPTH